VSRSLGRVDDPQDLLEQVDAVPIAQSNIVAVTATAGSPEAARALANAFAEQAVAVHTADVRREIDEQLAILEPQLEDAPDTSLGAASIADFVAQLQLLRAGNVPDLRIQTLAPLPSQASPRPPLVITAGLLAGLILGIAAAFAVQVLDPRLRREAQLRRLYRLPILGRIPKEPHSDERPLAPRSLSPVTAEAYRTLRATLTGRKMTGGRGLGSSDGRGRVILITGSSASEGKTTTAVNLATSLALASKRVILIESDLRRPVLADTLQAQEGPGGVVSVLIEQNTLEEALVRTAAYGDYLKLLVADYEGSWIAELFSIPPATRMLQKARQLADFVIIDSPPLNEVVDALPLAQQADHVVVVARIGWTRLDKLRQLGELLAENGVRPAGFAVVGTRRPARGEYHYYGGADSEDGKAQRRAPILRESDA
jgi:capsular exopolysaccharide synthesis family protein